MPRGNINNLIPNSERSPEQLREQTRKGGIKSGEARRAKKLLKDTLLAMLEEGDVQDNMCASLLDKAMAGDVKAFEVIRDTIGQKPKEEVSFDNKVIEIGLIQDED